MKKLLVILSIAFLANSVSAKIEVVKVNEPLKNFDLKETILNSIYFDYYDYDSSPTEEDWEELVSAAKMALVEKTLSSLPENAENYSPEKRITTIMKVIHAPTSEEESCTIEVRKQFGATVWKVTKKGGIYSQTTSDYWNARVLECK